MDEINYEKAKEMLKEYYPIENFDDLEKIMDPNEYEKLQKIVSELKPLSQSGLKKFMTGNYPKFIPKNKVNQYNGHYDDSDDIKHKGNFALSTGKYTFDCMMSAFERRDALQAIKCINIINSILNNFDENRFASKYKDSLLDYIKSNLVKFGYATSLDDPEIIYYLVEEIVNSKLNELKYHLAMTDRTIKTAESEQKVKKIEQEIILLEKIWYGESKYEKTKIEEERLKNERELEQKARDELKKYGEEHKEEIMNKGKQEEKVKAEEVKNEADRKLDEIITQGLENNDIQKNNSFTEQQLADIDEWKDVISSWQKILRNLYGESDENLIHKIICGLITDQEYNQLPEDMVDYVKSFEEVLKEYDEWVSINNLNLDRDFIINEALNFNLEGQTR